MKEVLKFWAYLFHFSLSALLMGIAIVAATNHDALYLDMLPFHQERLVSRVSIIAIIGFVCLFLALARIFEIVFPIWSLLLLGLLVWGFFFTAYSFQGPIGFGHALLVIFAAFLALLGSFVVLIPKRRDRW